MQGGGQGHANRNRREPWRDGRLAGNELGIEGGQLGNARERPGISSRIFIEQQRPRVLGRVLRRTVHQPDVMEAHRPGTGRQRNGGRKVERGRGRIDRTAEHSVGMMIIHWAPVRAGQHQQRAIARVQSSSITPTANKSSLVWG